MPLKKQFWTSRVAVAIALAAFVSTPAYADPLISCVLEHLKDYEFARVLGDATMTFPHKTPTEWFKGHRAAAGWREVRRDAGGNATAGRLRLPLDNHGASVDLQGQPAGANAKIGFYVVGEFNHWGEMPPEQLERFRLVPEDGSVYGTTSEIPLSHGMEYMVLRRTQKLNGQGQVHKVSEQLLDPTNGAYSTRGLLRKLGRPEHDALHSMFWDFEGPQHHKFQNPLPDWRRNVGGSVMEETDLMGLVRNWMYQGHRGPQDPMDTYKFVAESGILDVLAEHGVTRIKVMPSNQSLEHGGWQWGYQGYPYPINCHFGTPSEFARMADHANGKGIALVDDAVIGHFPKQGNPEGRKIDQIGLHKWTKADGKPLYGMDWETEWHTQPYDTANPAIDRYLRDAEITRAKRYGFAGVRVDNVSGGFGTGMYNRAGGFSALRGMNEELHAAFPGFYTNGEAFFSIVNQTRSLHSEGGVGFNVTNHGHLMHWIDENAKRFTEAIDMEELRHALESPIASNEAARTTHYKNHDEADNGKALPATEMAGAGWYYIERKTKGLDTLAAVSGGDYQSLLQVELGQSGSFGDGVVHWELLDQPRNKQLFDYHGALHRYFTQTSAFNMRYMPSKPINHLDGVNKVISFLKVDPVTRKTVLVVGNLGDHGKAELPLRDYRIGVPEPGVYHVKLDSESPKFGGQSHLAENAELRSDAHPAHSHGYSVVIPQLAPYQWIFLELK